MNPWWWALAGVVVWVAVAWPVAVQVGRALAGRRRALPGARPEQPEGETKP